MEDVIGLERLLALTKPLPRRFFARPAAVLAPALLGTVLVHHGCAGMIVEAEAYLGLDDPAAHAFRGLTPRTRVLFGPAGHAYVYFIYGMYECLNVVAGAPGEPDCVLIRALRPLAGLREMAERRRHARDLCGGPGKLTQALAITRAQYGADLCAGALQIRAFRKPVAGSTSVTPRIGIRENVDAPLRFLFECGTIPE